MWCGKARAVALSLSLHSDTGRLPSQHAGRMQPRVPIFVAEQDYRQ